MNSTNTNLDLKVGLLSRSLLKVGGETILQELQQKYPDRITLGNIAVSRGGNLPCKEIYHGVLVKWDRGQGTAEKVFISYTIDFRPGISIRHAAHCICRVLVFASS